MIRDYSGRAYFWSENIIKSHFAPYPLPKKINCSFQLLFRKFKTHLMVEKTNKTCVATNRTSFVSSVPFPNVCLIVLHASENKMAQRVNRNPESVRQSAICQPCTLGADDKAASCMCVCGKESMLRSRSLQMCSCKNNGN